MASKILVNCARRGVALTVLSALFGCGGGGGGGESAPVAAAPAPAPIVKQVLITQYGDSTTLGWYVAEDGAGQYVSPPPVQQLQVLLQAKYGDRVTVQERANGGWSIRDLIDGKPGFRLPLIDSVKDDQGQIATLRYGLNDTTQYGTAEFKGHLARAIQILQSAGKRVVMEEPNPMVSKTEAPYAAVVAQVAMEYGLPLVANHSLSAWSEPLSDGVHPTAAQYLETVPAQVPVLAPLIEALL